MADNKLLGASGLYYGSNEISKAYMGNNLVWEKDSGIYMVRGYNMYYSGGYQYGAASGFHYNCGNNNNFKIQIGLKNYFTTYSGSYGVKVTQGFCLNGYISNYSSGYQTAEFIRLGDGGFYSKLGTSYNTITTVNFGDTQSYLEFEITVNYTKCLTYNKQINYSNQNTAKLQYIELIPGSGNSIGYCNCSYHYVKIWDGNTLLHDIIAKKIDGSPGYYDKVDGSFFKQSDASSTSVKLYDDTSEQS